MKQPSFPPFRVLFSNDTILRRAQELARQIHVATAPEPPMLVAVIEGARPFARLLQKFLPGSLPMHEVRAQSYAGQHSSGKVTITTGADLPVQGRHVLLLEDIVDTGRTIAALREHFLAKGAQTCRVASLLSKPSRRVVPVAIEFLGFEIPDEFVLGFGMDLDGRYRELPDIVVYEAEVERAFQSKVASAST
ncbi:MAG: hypoxanthine phosphoribosyltransferase [Planctomycetes bacterium]|nr:hypoxanthine phosphoribosyltransferase [Planctomycetota bacterium]